MKLYETISDYMRDFSGNSMKTKNENGYLLIPASFDIETTTKGDHAYMYQWQFAIEEAVIFGRKWEEFTELLTFIVKLYKINPKTRKLIIWDHNFSFEFQFLKFRLNWAKNPKSGAYSIFATANTRIIKAETEEGLEFRDSLAISGYNLATLAKNYCKTQKMVGDLDYQKLRNSQTPLTDEEKRYCANDVIILKEYAEYLFSRFGGKIPLTKTGIVRSDTKDAFKRDPNYERLKAMIFACFPSEDFYKKMMQWLYKGGYVHANYIYCGVDIQAPVESFDFKSAYPSACFEKFPYMFAEIPVINAKKHLDDPDTWAVIIDAEFTDFETVSTHAIFSRHKAMPESEDILTDNGRIRYAKTLHVMINELEFEDFKNFYRWKKLKINKCWISRKHELPEYVKKTVAKYYLLKNSLKKGTPEYAESKEELNSIYGMMVTGLFHDELIFDMSTGNFEISDHGKPWFKIVQSQFLLPQWGVWITSICRHNLLSIVHQIGEDAIYSDTDSVKVLNANQYRPIIDEFNRKILSRNEKLKETGYDIGKLGIFDDEGTYSRFKTIGCKRYLYEQNGEVTPVIAGLPKKDFLAYCEKRKLNIWEIFSDKMMISASFTGKKRSKITNEEYSDQITDEFGNSEVMKEKSGVALLEVPFSMSLTEEYIDFVNYYLRKNQIIVGKRC